MPSLLPLMVLFTICDEDEWLYNPTQLPKMTLLAMVGEAEL
jgi:hypothetical protein